LQRSKNALAAGINDKKGKATTFLNAIALPIEIVFMRRGENTTFSALHRPMRKRSSVAIERFNWRSALNTLLLSFYKPSTVQTENKLSRDTQKNKMAVENVRACLHLAILYENVLNESLQ